MGLFYRMWRSAKSWLLTGIDRIEEPELILDRALVEMRRELEFEKNETVQIIAARNEIRAALQDRRERATRLEARAAAARKAGSDTLVSRLLTEKQICDQSIERLTAQLIQAEQAAASMKAAIVEKEAYLRQQAAERLALVRGRVQRKI